MSNLDPKYWNNKWPKAPIIYNGRALRSKSSRIGVDVKDFIVSNDEIVKNIIKKYRLDRGNDDQKAWTIQKWVVKFLRYVGDEKSDNCPEFWQFPFETLQSGVGDCEDGAILISSLMINAGIPPFKVKVSAGYVKPGPTAPEGGHAYNIYLASDNNWRICDWCFYEDSNLPILKKPLAKNGGYEQTYKEIWFTFNNEYSWTKGPVEVKDRISLNRTAKKSYVLNESKKAVKKILNDIDKIYKSK